MGYSTILSHASVLYRDSVSALRALRDKTGLCKRSRVINVASDVSKDDEHRGGVTTPAKFAVITSATMKNTIVCDVTRYGRSVPKFQENVLLPSSRKEAGQRNKQ